VIAGVDDEELLAFALESDDLRDEDFVEVEALGFRGPEGVGRGILGKLMRKNSKSALE
jgi:hypothetical protein